MAEKHSDSGSHVLYGKVRPAKTSRKGTAFLIVTIQQACHDYFKRIKQTKLKSKTIFFTESDFDIFSH